MKSAGAGCEGREAAAVGMRLSVMREGRLQRLKVILLGLQNGPVEPLLVDGGQNLFCILLSR
jgi:hypothetical protein